MPKRIAKRKSQSAKLSTETARPSFAVAQNIANFRISKKAAVAIVIIIVIVAVFFLKTSWFIAATVNGSPITTFELLSRMNSQYHEQILTQLINEKIIKSEIEKSGVSVSAGDIDKSISQIEQSVGGAAALDGLLSQQGQTRADLGQQLKIQLSLEKMYEKEATVSGEEITDYISKNKSQLTATDSAGQTKEAEEALKQQKLQKVFGEKFQEFRSNAKVTTY